MKQLLMQQISDDVIRIYCPFTNAKELCYLCFELERIPLHEDEKMSAITHPLWIYQCKGIKDKSPDDAQSIEIEASVQQGLEGLLIAYRGGSVKVTRRGERLAHELLDRYVQELFDIHPDSYYNQQMR